VTSESVNALRVFERSFVKNVLVPPPKKKIEYSFYFINVDVQKLREIDKIA
jgi:hypothetical protein